jgi:formate dehydrogenase major subunit
VTPVEQTSQWQQDYSRFNAEQLDLLRQRERALANAATGK